MKLVAHSQVFFVGPWGDEWLSAVFVRLHALCDFSLKGVSCDSSPALNEPIMCRRLQWRGTGRFDGELWRILKIVRTKSNTAAASKAREECCQKTLNAKRLISDMHIVELFNFKPLNIRLNSGPTVSQWRRRGSHSGFWTHLLYVKWFVLINFYLWEIPTTTCFRCKCRTDLAANQNRA